MSVDLRLCACGSGLRHVRCCGLDLSTLGPPEASRHLAPLIERALQSHRLGAGQAADRLCLEVLELSPGQPDMLWLLSRLREAQNLPAATEALVGRIVAADPNNVAATQDLGLRLLRRGAIAAAEQHARNAVRLAPTEAQSHYLLAMVLTEAHQPQIGEIHYRRALQLVQRRDPIVLANLAWCLKLQGRMADARALYQESLAAAPEVFQTLLGWAKLEEADRQFPASLALVDRAERIRPPATPACACFAPCCTAAPATPQPPWQPSPPSKPRPAPPAWVPRS